MPRDFTAHEKTEEIIGIHNAIAWNPSAEGMKVEDTLLTTSVGFEWITPLDGWPTVEIEGRVRPDLLSR